MKELKIDRDKMLKAAESCDTVKKVFEELWPEEFKSEPAMVDVTQELSRRDVAVCYSCYRAYEIKKGGSQTCPKCGEYMLWVCL